MLNKKSGMVPLFEHIDIDKYSYEEIPLNQDCLLMSEIYMEEFSEALIRMLEKREGNPYEVGYVGFVAGRKVMNGHRGIGDVPRIYGSLNNPRIRGRFRVPKSGNSIIAKVFYRAWIIERWGMGTQNIIDWCAVNGHPAPVWRE